MWVLFLGLAVAILLGAGLWIDRRDRRKGHRLRRGGVSVDNPAAGGIPGAGTAGGGAGLGGGGDG